MKSDHLSPVVPAEYGCNKGYGTREINSRSDTYKKGDDGIMQVCIGESKRNEYKNKNRQTGHDGSLITDGLGYLPRHENGYGKADRDIKEKTACQGMTDDQLILDDGKKRRKHGSRGEVEKPQAPKY